MNSKELEKLLEENEGLISHNREYKITDSREIIYINEKLEVLYKRKEQLMKLYDESRNKEEPRYDRLGLAGSQLSVVVERNKDVGLRYCSRCGGITNVCDAYPGLPIHKINTYGCSCP